MKMPHLLWGKNCLRRKNSDLSKPLRCPSQSCWLTNRQFINPDRRKRKMNEDLVLSFACRRCAWLYYHKNWPRWEKSIIWCWHRVCFTWTRTFFSRFSRSTASSSNKSTCTSSSNKGRAWTSTKKSKSVWVKSNFNAKELTTNLTKKMT